MGRMVHPSATPKILLTSKQLHSQMIPPLPTTVQDSRPSRNRMRRFQSTSLLTTLNSTTNPSDWETSGTPSLRSNPVPLDLMGSTTIPMKYLPQETLKILKDILNIWTQETSCISGERQLWSIPKPNKDHTDTLSYRAVALTSCLCKILKRMINTRFIWYLEKNSILDRSQCGFRKHRCTMDHLVSLERYVPDAFAWKQQAVGLFFDLEKAYETTWQLGIIWDLHRIGLRGRLPVFVVEYLRDRRIWVIIDTTLADEFCPEEGVPTGSVLAVTWFGLKINELPSRISRDIFRAVFVEDLKISFRGCSLDTIERHLQQVVNAIQEWATGNGFRFVAHKCKLIHFTAPPVPGLGHPLLLGLVTHLCQWRSRRNSSGFGGIHVSFQKHIGALKTKCKEALNLIRVVAHLKWGQRHPPDAVPGHCLFQARLWMHCVWHSIKYRPTPTGQHPQCWNKTGTWSVLHQSSFQYVHGGKRSSPGRTSFEAVHSLLPENSCLHRQPSTSCPTWIWPNNKRPV